MSKLRTLLAPTDTQPPAPALAEKPVEKRDYYKEALIDLSMNIPPITPTIWIRDSWACTEDGVLLVAGQKKAGKSITLTKLMQSALTPPEKYNPRDCLFIRSKHYTDKDIIYIDTEQARPRTQTFIKRIIDSVGLKEQPKNLKFFNLKRFSSAERVEFLKQAIFPNAKKAGLIIFDGIADFVKSMNDEVEAKELVELIEKNIPASISLVFVIHSGRNSSDAQGHLGQHLEKKCAGKIHISKDREKGIHTISCNMIRDNEDFEDILFQWNPDTGGFTPIDEAQKNQIVEEKKNGIISNWKIIIGELFTASGKDVLPKKEILTGIGERDESINRAVSTESFKKSLRRQFDRYIEASLLAETEKDHFKINF